VSASELAVVAIAELPLAAVGLGVIVSNYRLASKLIDSMGDRTRIVAPPKDQQAPGRDAQGHLRDARGRFTSRAGRDNVRELAG
jgi:hypothetical protein